MSLRSDVHKAFDTITPSMAGLSDHVVRTVLVEGATRRRKKKMLFRVRAPLALVAVFLLIALVAAVFISGRLIQDWNAFTKGAPAGQGDSYQSQVARLEATPLRITYPKTIDDCRSGPYNQFGDLGSGPVYGIGGGWSTSAWGYYYHNLAYADVYVEGPILVRAVDLFQKTPVIFVGQFATGTVVGTDTVDGQAYKQHVGLLVDATVISTSPSTHRFHWDFIAGVPNGWSGSSGWQINGNGFSEVFYVC